MADIVNVALQQVFLQMDDAGKSDEDIEWTIVFNNGKDRAGLLKRLGSGNYRLDRKDANPLYFDAGAVAYLIPNITHK